MSYNWPGNVRQLKHCVDRMAVLRSGGALEMADMPSALQDHVHSNSRRDLADVLEEHPFCEFVLNRPSPVISIPDSERQAIRNTRAPTRGERARTASLLPIGRTTLYRKMKQYGIE